MSTDNHKPSLDSAALSNSNVIESKEKEIWAVIKKKGV